MRRLVRNRAVQHLLALLLAAWAMSILVRYRILGSSVVAYLPWIGSLLVVLNVLFVVSTLIGPTGDGTLHEVAGRIDRAGRLAVVAFVWWAIIVVLNCALDRNPRRGLGAQIVGVGGRTVSAGVPLLYSWADVRGADGVVVRVALGPAEQRRFWTGEAVNVVDAPGRFGFRWLVSLERDPEPYVREILRLTPEAAQPWKDLVQYFMEHGREIDAAEEGRRYLRAHPDDVDFAYWAGENLNMRGFEAAGLPFLEHAVAERPTRYHSYRLAWLLTRQGDFARATDVLSSASARYPDAWEFPFLLAYVDAASGRTAAALDALQHVERLKPGVPDVASILAHSSSGTTRESRLEAGHGSRRVADPGSVR